jgi:uncharacterized protein (TIGR03067 family)
MRTHGLVLALVAGLLVAADKADKGGGKQGPKAIQGTWLIVSATEDGKTNDKAKDRKVVFEGKTMTVDTPGGQHKGTFTVDPKKMTFDISPSDGPQKGKIFKGIYELKGGQLKLCLARPDSDRPKEFKSEQGSGRILAVLKREEK